MESKSNTETNLVNENEKKTYTMKATKIPQDTSMRITALRFLLAVLVVFIHNNYTKENISSLVSDPVFFPNAFTETIQFIISDVICNCAVPLFYVFAAYLQIKKADSYKVLIKKRVKSLLVPYVLWTAIYLLYQFIYYYWGKVLIAKLIPSIDVHPDDSMLHWNIKDWFIQLIGYGKYLGYNVPYNHPLVISQFWFVRDLMILVLVSPILIKLIRKIPVGTFLFLCMVYFSCFDLYFVAYDALFFYALGLYWGIYSFDLFEKVNKISYLEIIILFIFSIIGEKYLSIETPVIMSRARVILSCILFLKLSGLIVKNEKAFAISKYFATFSFFLYAVHMPALLNIVQKIWIRILPMTNPFFCLLEYFVVTIIVILVGTALGIALKKICPKFFALLTGGR